MLVSFFLKHSNGYGSVSQDAKDVLTMHSPRDASQQLCYGRAKVDRVRSTELSLRMFVDYNMLVFHCARTARIRC